MATNVARLKIVLDALYDENMPNPKIAKVVDAIVETLIPEQIEAVYPGATAATLTNEQKAGFALDSLRQGVRNRVVRNAERKNMQQQMEARQAARQAAAAAASGL